MDFPFNGFTCCFVLFYWVEHVMFWIGKILDWNLSAGPVMKFFESGFPESVLAYQ